MAYQLRWTLITALFLSIASLSTCASVDLTKIHEHMTVDELSATFNVKDKAAVPDYEVVLIIHRPNHAHRNRRSIPAGHHVVTIKELTLYLEPVDHVLIGEDTPVYLASGNKTYPHGIRYERIENAWPKSLNMYQDTENNAAVVMYKELDGKVNVEGLIGDDTVIKPVPTRFKNSTSPNSHIFYRKKSINTSINPHSYLEKSYWSKKPQPSQPLAEVDTVYPEVLLIVDYMTYVAHGRNLQALCKYMAAFWNAVDLRFRSINNPKVRLNIAGLIVVSNAHGAPYMTKHIRGKVYLQAMETLLEVGQYLYGEERFGKDSYDIAIAVTDYKLCSLVKNNTNTVCDPATLGISRIGGACMREETPYDYGASVMEDHTGFDGVLVAAHEIGHLLGLEHDAAYEGNFERCHRDFHFLMAPSMNGSPNTFLWSDCSISLMNYLLRTQAECLRNKPMVKKPITKILPGQLVSRKEQCSFYEKMIACEDKREDECRTLYCRKPGTWLFFFNHKCVSNKQPAEGSSCSGGGMCLDGVCVHEEEENNEV